MVQLNCVLLGRDGGGAFRRGVAQMSTSYIGLLCRDILTENQYV